jgi:hypothetical protein
MSRISVSVHGISQEENIEAGEIRRLEIDAVQPYSSLRLPYPVDIYFQLFIQEGQQRIVVIDWQKVNRGSCNYFITLDTSWWIPNMYYIDIKYEYNGEVHKILDPVKFRLVNKLINPAR